MAKVNLVWKYPEDRMSITLEMHVDGEPKAHMILDAATFETVIHELADARSQMAEHVPPEIDPGSRLEAIFDPAWRTFAPAEVRAVGLALRHPGLGWLPFALPVDEARALGRSLMAIAGELEKRGDQEEP